MANKNFYNQDDEKQPDKKYSFSDASIHPEIREFKNLRTSSAPHPKPISTKKLSDKERIVYDSFFDSTSFGKDEKGGQTIVAILDTGVYAEHRLLNRNVIAQLSYHLRSVGSPDVKDSHGHGTHLAGIIAAAQSGKEKYGGIAPETKIVSIKVTNKKDGFTSLWKITQGLERVISYNADASNKSKITSVLIAFNSSDNVEEWGKPIRHRLSALINTLYIQRIPVIVSAGNRFEDYQQDGIGYPAYLDNVFVAGAAYSKATGYNAIDDLAEFSQRIISANSGNKRLFLFASGVNTTSCGIENPDDMSVISGSSQSAATLAGYISLIQGKFYKKHGYYPHLDRLKKFLMNSGRAIKVNKPGNISYAKTFLHADIKAALSSI